MWIYYLENVAMTKWVFHGPLEKVNSVLYKILYSYDIRLVFKLMKKYQKEQVRLPI